MQRTETAIPMPCVHPYWTRRFSWDWAPTKLWRTGCSMIPSQKRRPSTALYLRENIFSAMRLETAWTPLDCAQPQWACGDRANFCSICIKLSLSLLDSIYLLALLYLCMTAEMLIYRTCPHRI
ncbi:hypothetical protein PLICRDRAFT_528334 [Plicaturopsis crispa FD-325 SS-3]|nr:hypothetical protein PLICRDRAFT_528334 [Plicaturopsis crispa FD-325 SS-3]